MDIKRLIEPSEGEQDSSPSVTSLLAESRLIPYMIDYESGSLRETARRYNSSAASRRSRARRKEKERLIQTENDEFGVLRVQNHQDTVVVSPPSDILVKCQELFDQETFIFTPQQVFIVIQKMSTANDDYRPELHFLLRTMQTRLCSPGVYESAEGCFIRLAIAFSRVILLRGAEQLYPGLSNNEGHLVDIQDIGHGMWEVKVRFLSPEYVVTLRGSLLELAEKIHYKEPDSMPLPMKSLPKPDCFTPPSGNNGTEPSYVPRCKYNPEEMHFIWYHYVDLRRNWGEILKGFNFQFPSRQRCGIEGMRRTFFRFIEKEGAENVDKSPKSFMQCIKVSYPWMHEDHSSAIGIRGRAQDDMSI